MELLVLSGPDEADGLVVRVWVNGAEVTGAATIVTVDPRDGNGQDSWQEETESLRCCAAHSPNFNEALVTARESLLDSDYLDG